MSDGIDSGCCLQQGLRSAVRSCWKAVAITFSIVSILANAGCSDGGPEVAAVAPKPLPLYADPAAQPAQNELDLGFVPPDAVAAVFVFPDRIASRPWAADPAFRSLISSLMTADQIDLAGCQQLFVAICPSGPNAVPQWVGRSSWEGEVELSELVASIPKLKTEVRGERTFMIVGEGEMAFVQTDPQTIWVGTPSRIEAILSRTPSSGSLTRRLRALPLAGELEIVVDFGPLRSILASMPETPAGGMFGQGAGNGVNLSKALEDAKSLTVSVDSSSEHVLWARFDMGNEKSAAEMASTAKKQLAANRETVTSLLSLSTEWPRDARAAMDGLVSQTLQGIDLSAEQGVVSLKIASQADAPERLLTLAKFAVARMEVQMRATRFEQLAAAIEQYRQAKNDLPYRSEESSELDPDGSPRLSWRVHLLPYLGEQELYAQFHLDEPWDSAHNQTLISKMPAVFGSSEGKTRARGFVGVGMALDPKRVGSGTDAPETTLVIAESGVDLAVTWTEPNDWTSFTETDLAGAGEQGESTVLVVTAAGKVQRLPRRVDAKTLAALLTDRGEEKLEVDRIFGGILSRFGIPGLLGN